MAGPAHQRQNACRVCPWLSIPLAQSNGAEVFIATRRIEQAEALAKEFSCNIPTPDSPETPDTPGITEIDTVVNCTPVGMEGGNAPEGDPLHELAPGLELNASIRVIDTVYKPKETPLLLRAESAGCTIVYGEEMFRLQAAAQQKVWAD